MTLGTCQGKAIRLRGAMHMFRLAVYMSAVPHLLAASIATATATATATAATNAAATAAASGVAFGGVSRVGQAYVSRSDPITLSFPAASAEQSLVACSGPQGLKVSSDGATTWDVECDRDGAGGTPWLAAVVLRNCHQY